MLWDGRRGTGGYPLMLSESQAVARRNSDHRRGHDDVNSMTTQYSSCHSMSR